MTEAPVDPKARKVLEKMFTERLWCPAALGKFLGNVPRKFMYRVLSASQRVYYMQFQPCESRDNVAFISLWQTLGLSPLQAAMLEALRALAAEFNGYDQLQERGSIRTRKTASRGADNTIEYLQCLLNSTADLGLDWPVLIRAATDQGYLGDKFMHRCGNMFDEPRIAA